jgi:hypothetical protein
MVRSRKGIVAVLLLLCFEFPVWAQSTRIDSGTVSHDKFGFYWETRLMPGTPPLADISFRTIEEQGIIHRVLLDKTRHVYVGYDVIVEPQAEANSYRITIRPLDISSPVVKQVVLGFDNVPWTQMPTPGWGGPTNPQNIKGGDVLQLELLSNRATRQLVIDYVTVQEPARRAIVGFGEPPPTDRKFAFAPGVARDFKADDVEMTIQSPRLSINGKLDESTARRFDNVSGSVVWFATANRGRYLLSLLPHSDVGFQKAGEVRGSSLTFTVGKDTFTLNTGGRIAPGQGAYTLYVLHDPDFRLTYPNADNSVFVMGADDRPETLIRKK